MINLWYEESYWSYTNGRQSGPEKVVKNTIEALTQEKIPFSINQDKYPYNFLIQYQHEIAYNKHEKLEHQSCVIGPQFWPFDNSYGNFLINNPQYYKKLIAPSQWVKNLYVNKFNIPSDKVSIWPVGIQVPEIKSNISIDCLVYCKNREETDLNFVLNFLREKNLSFEILNYGSYSPSDFKYFLSKVKFCFIVGNTESQGVAIQEMMGYNKPLFVWDVQKWDHMGEEYSVPSSSVPYWSDKCGERFFKSSQIENSFEKFYDNINYYEPKKIIEDELSYSHSVKKLIKIFEE